MMQIETTQSVTHKTELSVPRGRQLSASAKKTGKDLPKCPEDSIICGNGVCMITWKPKRPQA